MTAVYLTITRQGATVHAFGVSKPVAMTQLTDDLLLLEELRRAGSLTDDEFAIAKARVLTGVADTDAVTAQAQLAEETQTKLRRLELQNRLMVIENNWDDVQKTILIRDKYGRTTVPTIGNAIGIAVVGSAASLVFSIIALANGVPIVLPLVFLVFCAIAAISMHYKATEYNTAEANYLRQKSDIESQIWALKTGRGRDNCDR